MSVGEAFDNKGAAAAPADVAGVEEGVAQPGDVPVEEPRKEEKPKPKPSKPKRPSKKTMLTVTLAIAAGWADIVCFKQFGSFAALMTGNTVKLGMAIVQGGGEDGDGYPRLYFASILISYILGVIAFQACKRIHPGRPAWVASILLILLMALTDILYSPTENSPWRVCLLSPCFGMQNSMTFGGPMAINSTIITGNMQKIGIAIWKIMSEGKCLVQLKAMSRPLAAWTATLAGALAGGACLMRATWYVGDALFVPVVLLQVCCFVIHDWLYGKPRQTSAASKVDAKAQPQAV